MKNPNQKSSIVERTLCAIVAGAVGLIGCGDRATSMKPNKSTPVLEQTENAAEPLMLTESPSVGYGSCPNPNNEEDTNKGHGNNPDGYDPDNPGKGPFDKKDKPVYINRPPVLQPIEDIVANEGELVKITPVATDPDGDVLTFDYSYPLDSNGEWQTDFDDSGSYNAIVGVSDGELKDYQTVNVTVNDFVVNEAPSLDTIEDIVANENDLVTIPLTATDLDLDFLTFKLENAPAGMEINPSTDEIEWQTDFNSAGDYTVKVIVEDGNGGIDYQDVNVKVNNVPNYKVAFTSKRDGNHEIYTMDKEGGSVQRVTDNPANDTSPALSPDGTEVAFVSDRDGDSEIYVKNILSGNVRKLTDNTINDQSPEWSPDGKEIVYDSGTSGRHRDVFKMSAVDGTNKVNLTNRPTILDRNSSWSPDGLEIAFESCMDEVGGNPEIYRMNSSDGSNVVRLTFCGAGDYCPQYSPDGLEIAMHSFRHGNAEVYKMSSVDGSGLTRLTSYSGVDASPVYSPDGKKILISSDRNGGYEVYRMNRDGTSKEKLTDTPGYDGEPSCSK